MEIAGAMVNRATLHNYSEIEKKNIMLNDRVVVIRSGDVIPKIIKPLESYRDGSQQKIMRPKVCPIRRMSFYAKRFLLIVKTLIARQD